jgi:colanic acid/amylovoran biosynthesis protein
VKAFLLNTHSTLNSGDFAIVLAQAQYLEEKFPGIRLSLTSRTPEVDQPVYQSKGINVIPSLIPAPSVFDTSKQKFQQSLQNLLDIQSKSCLKKEIQDSDFVISSGGGYFYTKRRIFPGPMFLQNLAHVKLAYRLKKPVVFFPQSFGPINNALSLHLLGKTLNNEKALRVYAREGISLDFLKHHLKVNTAKIELCPDMAFYLSLKDFPETQKISLDLPGPVVALTLRNWDFPEIKSRREKKEKSDNYFRGLEEICREIFKRWKGSFFVFPQVRGPGRFEDDRDITLKFWGRLKRIIPEDRRRLFFPENVISPYWLMHLLSQADLIVATRFHSAIFAFIVGTPAVAITYQPKSLGMMRMLNLEKFAIDMKNMDAHNVLRLAEEAFLDSHKLKWNIIRKVDESRKNIRMKLEGALERTN